MDPFSFFGIVRFFSENKKFSPLQFLQSFTTMGVQKSRGVPPFCFSALWDFFSKICFFAKGSPFNCDKNVENFRSVPPFYAASRRATRSTFFDFSIFEYCKLTLGSPFAIFEPWIWRRLEHVPACSVYVWQVTSDRKLAATLISDDWLRPHNLLTFEAEWDENLVVSFQL